MKRKKIGQRLELLSIILVLAGIIGMCQPFIMLFYTYGFTVLLAGVVLYNIAAHL